MVRTILVDRWGRWGIKRTGQNDALPEIKFPAECPASMLLGNWDFVVEKSRVQSVKVDKELIIWN